MGVCVERMEDRLPFGLYRDSRMSYAGRARCARTRSNAFKTRHHAFVDARSVMDRGADIRCFNEDAEKSARGTVDLDVRLELIDSQGQHEQICTATHRLLGKKDHRIHTLRSWIAESIRFRIYNDGSSDVVSSGAFLRAASRDDGLEVSSAPRNHYVDSIVGDHRRGLHGYAYPTTGIQSGNRAVSWTSIGTFWHEATDDP